MTNFNKNLKLFIQEQTLNINNIMPKQNLHSDFWDKMSLNEVVLAKLRKISDNISKELDISDILEDVILTGSIASFNWHSLSDIDLHFVFDFSKVNEDTELVKKMLDLTRMKWNKDHKIMIFGHEVEIYFQNSNEDHESAGVYSISKGQWVENPTVSASKPDGNAVKVKAVSIIREIDRIQELFVDKKYHEAYHYSKTLKRKIRNMRKVGLMRDGVFSVENMAFKALRNNEKLNLLSFLKNMAYDQLMSIKKLVKIKKV